MLFYFPNKPIMKKALTSAERRTLKQEAHHLKPVVMIGHHGLTEAVIRETETALQAHELIKIRITGDEREVREQIATTLTERLNAQLIAHIGKLLILWRKKLDKN